MAAEPVGDAANPSTGVAGGEHVGGRIPHHDSFLRSSLNLPQRGLHADGIGLFALEAVAAIDEAEAIAQAQPVEDGAAEADGLVG